MKNNCYESPLLTFFFVNEDVILASTVLDDGDKGIGYEIIFGD